MPVTACSTGGPRLGRVRPALVVAAEPVQVHAQPDQVLQRVDVDVAGDDGRHRGVAGDRRGGVPVQPRPVAGAGLGQGLRAAGGPPGPDLPGSNGPYSAMISKTGAVPAAL